MAHLRHVEHEKNTPPLRPSSQDEPLDETTSDDAEKPDTPPGVDVQTGEVLAPQSPLIELQEKLRALLDFDQLTEVRLALFSRMEELEKHLKKGSQLGIAEQDARRRILLIDGSDIRYGLARIFAAEVCAYDETRDLFFDKGPDGQETGGEEDGGPIKTGGGSK